MSQKTDVVASTIGIDTTSVKCAVRCSDVPTYCHLV